jgi:hypothetical protein
MRNCEILGVEFGTVNEDRHKDRACEAVTGLQRRARSAPAFRRRSEADSFRLAFYACAPRTCVQEEIARESEQARAETKARCLDQRAFASSTINQIAAPTRPSTNQKTRIFLIALSDLSIDPRCIKGIVDPRFQTRQ